MKRALAAPLLAALLAATPAAAQPGGDEWRFTVAPYLYLPTIESTLKFRTPNGTPEETIKANPGDYLSDVNGALMIAMEARKGKWLVATDLTYLKLSANASAVKTIDFGPNQGSAAAFDAGSNTSLSSTIWTLVGGYNLVQEPKFTLDLIAGTRYLYLKGKVDWNLTASVTAPGGGGAVFPASGSVTKSGDIWDAIVGVKGRVRLGESWFVPYYLDAGTGNSKYTVQAQTGIGYGFSWGDLVLAYRYLAWKQDDDTKPIQELKLYGFGFGGVFHF